MPTLHEALAARGLTDRAARKRERDRLRRVRERQAPRYFPSDYGQWTFRPATQEEARLYVRAFEELNRLVPTRVEFPPPNPFTLAEECDELCAEEC